MRLRRLILLSLVALCVSFLEPWKAVVQAAWSCSTGSVVNIQTGSGSPTSATAVLPTNAPANATKWAASLNRTNNTALVTAVASTADATGWTASSSNPIAVTSNNAYVYYKVGATSGADTVTFTWNANINTQTVVGWCDDDASGSAQTFQTENSATITTTTAWVGTAINVSPAGGIVAVDLSNNTWSGNTPNAGETYATTNPAGARIFGFTLAGSGSLGTNVTSGTSASGKIITLAFNNAVAASGARNMTLLGIGDR